MLIAIYFLLKNLLVNVVGNTLSTVGVILIMGFGISLMLNTLTHNSHATDTYINGIRSGVGRIIRALVRGVTQLFRIVFYKAPRWVYRKAYGMLKGKVADGLRTALSIATAVLTVVILV